MEIGFEGKLVWLNNWLFPYNFKHSISRAIIFSWLKWLDEKRQEIVSPCFPEECLRGLSVLPDRHFLGPWSRRAPRVLRLSPGTLPRIPWLCGKDTPKCPGWVRLCPERKCEEERRLLLPQPVKWFLLQYFCQRSNSVLWVRASGNGLS